jgi:16S rRNA (uracil1498-N3)-methyltransferase
MAERFFVDQVLGPGRIELDGPEAHHLATVCRLRVGDSVCLFNGDGHQYPAVIGTVGRRKVGLEVSRSETPPRELPCRLEVAAPLPKGERADFLIEKLTELGVTAFTPLQTERSVVHPSKVKQDRLRRHVIEASKQCGRNVLMELRPLTSWDDLLARHDLPAHRVLAHPGTLEPISLPGSDTIAAVGPEGGFTEEEVAAALTSGWVAVSLGPRLLRVETAALALAVLGGACATSPGEA